MPTTDVTRRSRRDEALLRRYAADPTPQRMQELAERYQPLVHSLAARYNGRREPLEDLIQVANLGLVKAVKGYDPDRGNTFTTYAVPTITGELKRHFRDHVWNLRLPRGLQESSLKVERALDKLTERLGRTPEPEELAAETGLTTRQVAETLVARQARWTSSLDAPIAEDGATSAGDMLPSIDQGFDRVEANAACERTELEPREREAIRLRFVDGLTQAEVGERIGCSQMQVSRISRRGLAKLLAAVRGEDGVAVPVAS